MIDLKAAVEICYGGHRLMARLSECHRTLKNGVGKCSVPMWCGGLPAGFCDAPAYGKPLRTDLPNRRGHYEGYVPGLACWNHGGPSPQDSIKGKTVIRFDGPPGPEAGRLIEVERDGRSINAGYWLQDGEDWLLVLTGSQEGERLDEVRAAIAILKAREQGDE